jgi:hypothetical protein
MSISLALPVHSSMMFEGLTSPCTIPSRCRADGADGPSRSTAMAIPGSSRGWGGPDVTITSLRWTPRSSPDRGVGDLAV